MSLSSIFQVRCVWKSKLSVIAVLFGVIRFLAVAVQAVALGLNVGTRSISNSVCKAVIWYQAFLGLIMSTCVDILLIYRVYAFYGRNKKILISLCIFETMAFVAVLGTLIVALSRDKVARNPFADQLHIGSCIISDVSTLSSSVWIPILCVQTTLFCLAAGRYIYLQWKGPLLFSTLYYTFLGDGIWTFLVLFIVDLLCIIGNSINSVLGLICFYWCFPLVGTCASRLILNLRSASYSSQDYGFDVSHRTNTKMEFDVDGTQDSDENACN